MATATSRSAASTPSSSAAASASAVTTRSSSRALVKTTDSMAPRKVQPKDDRTVLDEDLYTESLAHIIERDFFPHLSKLRAQEEYLEALEKNDMARLREITARYARTTQTPGTQSGATPRMPFATPAMGTPGPAGTAPSVAAANVAAASVTREAEQRLQSAGVDVNMSLDAFQSRYTSEDDASFSKLAGRLNEKHRQRYSWMFEQKDRPRAIENGGDAHDQKTIETWDYKAKNGLMYYVEGAPMTEEERANAMDNGPKINYSAFKEPLPVFKSPLPSSSSGAAAIAAAGSSAAEVARYIQRQAMRQGGLTPSAHTPAPPAESPRVGGYSFVASTPALEPGVDATPLMTWGTIEGTPLLLDPTMTPLREGEPYFKLQEESKREQLANALSESVAKQYRKRARLAKVAKSPMVATGSRTPGRSAGNLTPNAATLLHRLTGDDQLRASYRSPMRTGTGPARKSTSRTATGSRSTPTVAAKASSTRSAASAAAAVSSSTAAPAAAPGQSALTDDLLKL